MSRMPLTKRISLITFMLVIAGTVVAVASTPSSEIESCYNELTGYLRVITPGDACRPDEKHLAWNQTGAEGPAGPEGAGWPVSPPGAFSWSGGTDSSPIIKEVSAGEIVAITAVTTTSQCSAWHNTGLRAEDVATGNLKQLIAISDKDSISLTQPIEYSSENPWRLRVFGQCGAMITVVGYVH